MEKNIVWIDWMKAFLIIFVIIGHSGSFFSGIVYLFHVPAFFFISGYLCNYSKPNQGSLWNSRFMILSILIYNIVFIIFNAITAKVWGLSILRTEINATFHELITRPFLGIVWCNYQDNPMTAPLCSQFWFVWVLIIIKSLFKHISTKSLSFKSLVCIVCVTYIIIIYHFNIQTFFYIDITICAAPFFIIGNIAQQYNSIMDYKTYSNYKKILISSILIFLISSIGYLINRTSVDMFLFKFGKSILLYYTMALVGIFAMILFCQTFPECKIIKLISIGTFFILAMHLLLIRHLIQFNIIQLDRSRLLEVLIIVLISIPCIIICEKKCPLLLGKKMLRYGKKMI